MQIKKLQLAVLAVGALASAASVNAQVSGEIWGVNTGETIGLFNADPSNIPGGPGTTFNVPNGVLNFNQPNSNPPYTVGSFLATASAYNIAYNGTSYGDGGTSQTGDQPMASGSTIDNTIMTLTGQVTLVNGQTYSVTHDDGVVVYVSGNPFIS